MKYFTPVTLVFLLACSSQEEGRENPEPVISAPEKSPVPEPINKADTTAAVDSYTYETFETTGIPGWGYRILLNGEVYISQPHIPAIQGNKGFSNPFDAIKTAEFAISKIRQGIVPPTITVDELDSLGVLD